MDYQLSEDVLKECLLRREKGQPSVRIWQDYVRKIPDAPSFQVFAKLLAIATKASDEEIRALSVVRAPLYPPLTQFSLGDRVEEEELSDNLEEATQKLKEVRDTIAKQIRFCEDEPVLDAPGKDMRSVRAGAIATLANAFTAAVNAELRIADTRTKRTVLLHNLRLERADLAADQTARARSKEKLVANGKQKANLFLVELPSEENDA